MHITLLILDFELCAIIREDTTTTTTTTLSQIALRGGTFTLFVHSLYISIIVTLHYCFMISMMILSRSLCVRRAATQKSIIHRFLLKLSTK